MLGFYIMGFEPTLVAHGFALLTGVCLSAGYALIGSTWLILKTEGDLQHRAVRFARMTLGLSALGMVAISLATPLVSPRIFEKWFAFPSILLLAPIPLVTGLVFVALWVFLRAHAAGRPFARRGAVRGGQRAVPAGVLRPRLFVLPLCGARALTIWQARVRAGKPVHHLPRRVRGAAGDRRLLGLRLLVFRGKAGALRYD